ncbi:MAG: hypothetical protein V4736_08950 [Bdellovibrionota bacterium]
MGVKNFGRNTFDFSRYTGADKQVFFFMMFKRKSDVAVASSSYYGSRGVTLKKEYAKNNGWASPFVMYEHELVNASKIHDPNIAEEYHRRGPSENIGANFLGFDIAMDLAKQMINSTAKLDLTVEDAEVLMKQVILLKLHELRNQYPLEYRNAIKVLSVGDVNMISHFVQSAFVSAFKLEVDPHFTRGRFEVKVPVAVPPEALVHF